MKVTPSYKIGDVVSFDPEFSSEPSEPLFVVTGIEKVKSYEGHTYSLSAYSETPSYSIGDSAYHDIHVDSLRKRKIKRVKVEIRESEFKVGSIVTLNEKAQVIGDGDIGPFENKPLVIEQIEINYGYDGQSKEIYVRYDYVLNTVKRKKKEPLWIFEGGLERANALQFILT